MKIGTAGTLAEVSPEHFQQLATAARLSRPMVRERVTDLAVRVAEACRQLEGSPDAAAKTRVPSVVVLERAERMVRLAAAQGYAKPKG